MNFYLFIAAVISSFMYILFNIHDLSLIIVMSLNTLIILFGIYLSLKSKMITVDLIYWLFNYFFFIIAVVVQLQNSFFPNTFPVDTKNVIQGQLILSVWNAIFLLIRSKREIKINENRNDFISNKTIIIYFIISSIVFGFTFLRFGFDFFYGYIGFSNIGNKASSLLLNAVVSGILYVNFIFQFYYFKYHSKSNRLILYISTIQLFYVISPFNTTRYSQGFYILFFIWFFYRNKINPLIFSLIFIFGLFVIFPFLNIFMVAGFTNNIDYNILDGLNQLNELHFDAFSSFLVTIDYVQRYGPMLGYNLLGAVLFFVPRDLWSSKPISSGEIVGQYLNANYTLNFDNLSNPLISEAYLSFGIIGIIIGAILFALFINFLEKKLKDSIYFEIIYGITLSYLFIILRGSLMVALSSYLSMILIMLVIPKLLRLIEIKKIKASYSIRKNKEVKYE